MPVSEKVAEAEGMARTAEIRTEVEVASTVSVALQSAVSMDLVPKVDGAFSGKVTELTVATNNLSGYQIFMRTGGETANLENTDKTQQQAILPVEAGSRAADFENNTWGYVLDVDDPTDESRYNPITAKVDTLVKEVNETTTDGDVYKLAFGVKVDTTLPAGLYSNSVIVSVVANPTKITSLNQLTYMQDMTADICANTTEHVTKQLIDIRDGKSYWVAKLKDGNCWMTQNLALDLSTNKTLTPADTDIVADYTPTSSTNSFELDRATTDGSSVNQYSWNMGMIVEALPEIVKTCGNYRGDGFNSALSSDNLAEMCRAEGLVDVSSAEWRATHTTQPGVFNGNKYDLVAVDEANHTYDAHYLFGNYYQWNAATAGTASGNDKRVATGSICPKGWMLPTADAYDEKEKKGIPLKKDDSFYNLTLAYDYPETSRYLFDDDGNVYTTIINDAQQNVYAAPFYCVRTGYVGAHLGYVRYVGGLGALWSNRKTWSGSSTFAFAMRFHEMQLSPTYGNGQFLGQNVRCLAR